MSVADANGNKTTYTYDSMDRRASRKDALGATETYAYDGNGNLTQFTDRRGKVTVYQYDGLNRLIFAGYGSNGSGQYESTINYTYDAGDRLTQAVDSIAETIVRTYDDFDRLTGEQTLQGDVTYNYDAAGRRHSMGVTVTGQPAEPAVTYGWDNANRLTGITQGSTSVGFSYDTSNRRTQLTLPNGTVLAYAYDADSRITAMNWTLGGNPVGDLEYAYDADGRVIQKTGSLASVQLPSPVSGNTFNADNEMTALNGATLTYDADGNLTSDGTNSYLWDARGHLSTLAGTNLAAYEYDAFGRRVQNTLNGVMTQYLYDGLNPVAEMDGASPPNPTANMLTGLGIDEYFQRSDSSGTLSYLTDMLGSTVALADSSGTLDTTYTYDPFGNVTANGSSGNPYQFTDRENDGTGLYYYRARYYSPTLQRFVAQDPIGFAGGDTNLYGYVMETPTNITDASGLCGKHPCVGLARVLKGNSRNISHPGATHLGAFGKPVQANSGDIAPEQFGYPSGPDMQKGLIDPSQITGTAGAYAFTVGDVIGGRSPIPGMNVRAALQSLNPGLFLLELPRLSRDPGILPVILWLPEWVPCPKGTVPVPGTSFPGALP